MATDVPDVDLAALISGGKAFGLSPEDFLSRSVATQRGRMLVAAVLVVAERGYQGASVRDIVSVAGVSRSSFYENFDGKDDCLNEAYRAWITTSVTRMADAAMAAADHGWHAGMVAGVQSVFDGIREQPAVARAIYVELPSAGTAVLATRHESNDRFAEHVDALAAEVRRIDPRMPEVPLRRIGLLMSGLDLRIAYALHEGTPEAIDAVAELAIEVIDALYSPILAARARSGR